MSRSAWRPALAGLALSLVATGCGVPGNADQSTGPKAEASGSPATQLRVGLSEWTIATSADVVAAGDVELVVTNAGGTEHDLVVQGEGGRWETDDLDPGQQDVLRIHTSAGETLRLWCSEPGHEAQGMKTQLDVAP